MLIYSPNLPPFSVVSIADTLMDQESIVKVIINFQKKSWVSHFSFLILVSISSSWVIVVLPYKAQTISINGMLGRLCYRSTNSSTKQCQVKTYCHRWRNCRTTLRLNIDANAIGQHQNNTKSSFSSALWHRIRI